MASPLENAVVRLLRERPFYGHFLLNLRREERDLSGKPAGVTVRDGIPTLAVDPAAFTALAATRQQALLEHLVKHLLHLHPLRRKGRPLTAAEVLNDWTEVAGRAAAQRDDVQAATINDLTATLQASPLLTGGQEENLVGYIGVLPRDLCFGLVKTLLRIPEVALLLVQDKHDGIIFDAVQAISRQAR